MVMDSVLWMEGAGLGAQYRPAIRARDAQREPQERGGDRRLEQDTGTMIHNMMLVIFQVKTTS
jgi:hypothetical protein